MCGNDTLDAALEMMNYTVARAPILLYSPTTSIAIMPYNDIIMISIDEGDISSTTATGIYTLDVP